MKSEKVNCIDFVLWIYDSKRCKGCFIPLHLCQNKKRLITKEMGPICRKDVWSPLLNAFNQVRRPCSTFYASIDSGHAFMKHTIIESKKSKIVHKVQASTMVSSFLIKGVKITHLEMLKVSMIVNGLLFISVVEVIHVPVSKMRMDVVSSFRSLSFILGPLYRYSSPSK